MDPREQFFTDEFYRYSAECRRLGRLARRPPSETKSGSRGVWAAIERLGELQKRIIYRPIERPAYGLVARAVPSHR